MESAILGGGCFWCLEPVFRALRGVTGVDVGFCGGSLSAPTYEQVCAGDTGHVEVVSVSFDPQQITYGELLAVFFAVHDPTSLNRQGHDVGTQYASVIFTSGPAQQREAEAARTLAQAQHAAPICTRIEPAGPFWPAQAVHQQYFDRNPQQPYCRLVIAPKMAAFRKRFAALLTA